MILICKDMWLCLCHCHLAGQVKTCGVCVGWWCSCWLVTDGAQCWHGSNPVGTRQDSTFGASFLQSNFFFKWHFSNPVGTWQYPTFGATNTFTISAFCLSQRAGAMLRKRWGEVGKKLLPTFCPTFPTVPRLAQPIGPNQKKIWTTEKTIGSKK